MITSETRPNRPLARLSGRSVSVRTVTRTNRAALDALIAEATVDCYNDSECITGFYTMLEDHLAVPFETTVLGVRVTVQRVDMSADEDRKSVV